MYSWLEKSQTCEPRKHLFDSPSVQENRTLLLGDKVKSLLLHYRAIILHFCTMQCRTEYLPMPIGSIAPRLIWLMGFV